MIIESTQEEKLWNLWDLYGKSFAEEELEGEELSSQTFSKVVSEYPSLMEIQQHELSNQLCSLITKNRKKIVFRSEHMVAVNDIVDATINGAEVETSSPIHNDKVEIFVRFVNELPTNEIFAKLQRRLLTYLKAERFAEDIKLELNNSLKEITILIKN